MVLLTSQLIYPESDGKPMADNTEQFNWIVLIKENCEILFAEDATVFVAGDLLWYPVEGNNRLCQAPDAMVVKGRPKGKRGSYQQWKEGNIPPQVVFVVQGTPEEILSPGNTLTEMAKKFAFYQLHQVEEYYLYDPTKNDLSGWLQNGDNLIPIEEIQDWVSPQLGIRFAMTADTLEIYRPDGKKFLSPVELAQRNDIAEQQVQQQFQRAEQEFQRAELEFQRVEQEVQARLQAQQVLQQTQLEKLQLEQKAERLAARLRELGMEP